MGSKGIMRAVCHDACGFLLAMTARCLLIINCGKIEAERRASRCLNLSLGYVSGVEIPECLVRFLEARSFPRLNLQ